MAMATNTITIRCTPEKAYAFLADGLNNPTWRPAVVSIALAHGTSGQVGAVYHQMMKGPMGRPVDGSYRIAETVPNVKIRFEVIAGPARPVGVFEIRPDPSGAIIRFSLSFEPRGLMRLMNGMIQKAMDGEVGNLDRLKAALESG